LKRVHMIARLRNWGWGGNQICQGEVAVVTFGQ
jgi:hypothetical protein